MSEGSWVVRPATTAAAAACAAIYEPYVRETAITFETEPPTPDQLAARIADFAATHAWIVLERDGEVLGYAYAHRLAERAAYDWSCETSIYVAPGTRGLGVGRTLYRALLPILAGRGYRRAYALIALPNPASVAIHESFGFETVGVLRRVGWKLEAWHDVAWMQRDLLEPDDGRPPAAIA
ncbi:MAG: N-acetyltransferase family protein [Propionicimonas sp.]